MKRWMLTILAAMAVILPKLGTPATDIGQLEPVAVVQVIQGGNVVRLRTDTGAEGRGSDFLAAVKDLREKEPKEVFLDTADYMLLWGNPEMEQILRYFRPACGLCRAEPDTDLETAAAYLRLHPPEKTLGDRKAGERENQRLIIREGRGSFWKIPKETENS